MINTDFSLLDLLAMERGREGGARRTCSVTFTVELC